MNNRYTLDDVVEDDTVFNCGIVDFYYYFGSFWKPPLMPYD